MAKEEKVTKPVALSMDTLGDLDNGIFGMMVDKEIDSLVKDVSDRGAEDGKERTLNITVGIVVSNGVPIITPRVQAKMPPRQARSTAAKERMKSKGQSEFVFQPTNKDNAGQGTFADDDLPEDEA